MEPKKEVSCPKSSIWSKDNRATRDELGTEAESSFKKVVRDRKAEQSVKTAGVAQVWRQKDQGDTVILCYIASSGPAWATWKKKKGVTKTNRMPAVEALIV